MPRRRVVTVNVSNPIDLAVGECVVVELAETPSTGFRWQVEAEPPLTLLESCWDPAVSAAIGGAGTRRLTLRSDAPGTAQLNVKLWRQWEGDSSVIHRHTFEFAIH